VLDTVMAVDDTLVVVLSVVVVVLLGEFNF